MFKTYVLNHRAKYGGVGGWESVGLVDAQIGGKTQVQHFDASMGWMCGSLSRTGWRRDGERVARRVGARVGKKGPPY